MVSTSVVSLEDYGGYIKWNIDNIRKFERDLVKYCERIANKIL